MHRRTLLTAGLAAALAGSLAGCAGGPGTGSKRILRLALNQTETHPSFLALDAFSKSFEAATDGEFLIDIFANEVLGAQQEILNLQRNNIVDLAIISSTQLENINQDFRVFNVPRVFDDVDHQMRVVRDESISGDLFRSLQQSNNLLVIGAFTQGERNIYAKRAVTSPDDMRGLKVRVQESPVMLRMIEAMGGSPTPMAFGEVYTALQAGVLDGAENNEVSYWTQKHYEVAPVYSYTKHLVGIDYMVASASMLDDLPAEVRPIFDAEWARCMEHFTELWGQSTQEAIDGCTAGGATFEEIDTAAFDERLTPLAESLLTSDVQKSIYERTREVSTS
ncbi:TRAP transporter substrate-binding protein [Propioniciclava sp. MC1683]|uniref:TRAP transporter substrate-binding protein n=1 Tax=Propioniciclava sp. MC1683 TaxID=2760309 RepID=UPI0016039C53|nr:TRAP transporter substrate-binding protein [Propioniciclava sp. MC1683]MBB1502104.1 TRAP transporter substrate-binding protein [Propioniciclava sp. MC1683]